MHSGVFLNKTNFPSPQGQRLNFAPCDIAFELQPCEASDLCVCEVIPWNRTSSATQVYTHTHTPTQYTVYIHITNNVNGAV